jgi:DNA mismatch repair ATPase MutS
MADDLNEGVSTFYAELKRIKGIIDAAKDNTNIIFLIDEIFRGTNSVDRFYGAKTVLLKLNALGETGIITTHDLQLCGLAEQCGRIKNYSFSEHYRDNQILFDYKIREGKSNTTNAKYLMEMIGIL